MPQDSKAKRKLRRIKRERTIAYRMVDHLTDERNAYRDMLAKAYADRMKKEGIAPTEPPVVPQVVGDEVV